MQLDTIVILKQLLLQICREKNTKLNVQTNDHMILYNLCTATQ